MLTKNVSVQYLLENNALYSGELRKYDEGLLFSKCSKKYGVVHDGYFYVFNSFASTTADVSFLLIDAGISECPKGKDHHSFYLECEERKTYFTVNSEKEMREWVTMLCTEKRKHSNLTRTDPDGGSFSKNEFCENNNCYDSVFLNENFTDAKQPWVDSKIRGHTTIRGRSHTTLEEEKARGEECSRRHSSPADTSPTRTRKSTLGKISKLWKKKSDTPESSPRITRRKHVPPPLKLNSSSTEAINPYVEYPPSPCANYTSPLMNEFPQKYHNRRHSELLNDIGTRQHVIRQTSLPVFEQQFNESCSLEIPRYTEFVAGTSENLQALPRSPNFRRVCPPASATNTNIQRRSLTPNLPRRQSAPILQSYGQLTRPVSLMIPTDACDYSVPMPPRSPAIKIPRSPLVPRACFTSLSVDSCTVPDTDFDMMQTTDTTSRSQTESTMISPPTPPRGISSREDVYKRSSSLGDLLEKCNETENSYVTMHSICQESNESCSGLSLNQENIYVSTSQTNLHIDEDIYVVPETKGSSSENEYLPSSVYQWGLDRNGANDLLMNLQVPGLYVIRTAKDEKKVLSVYVNGEIKHYKIFQENGHMYLHREHPSFPNIYDLVRYYRNYDLPTCAARLQRPYK